MKTTLAEVEELTKRALKGVGLENTPVSVDNEADIVTIGNNVEISACFSCNIPHYTVWIITPDVMPQVNVVDVGETNGVFEAVKEAVLRYVENLLDEIPYLPPYELE